MVRREWLQWLYILLRFGIPTFLILFAASWLTLPDSLDPRAETPLFQFLIMAQLLAFVTVAPLALFAIILRVWLLFDDKALQRKGQSYAELNGWLPFSSTHWRKVKRGNLAMSTAFASEASRYILRIELDDVVLATDIFEAPQYAMRFADYIWENKLSHLERIFPHDVQQGWSQSRAIALR